MAEVYALLVGIDNYRNVKPDLRGCVNDVRDVEKYLTAGSGRRVQIEMLLNERATRSSVVEAFRRHLSKATDGDAALFWFAGHGSTAPLPRRWWHLEPNGTTMQTLVCVDSRGDGVPDLLDKELAVLLEEVAAGGAHVAVVLDCCHSGGATRVSPSAQTRQVEPMAPPADPALVLEELVRRIDGGNLPELLGPPSHVALAACREHQLAYEVPDTAGRYRGVFSLALLTQLRQPSTERTYRDLLASVRNRVENTLDGQVPVLFPADAVIADRPFLGGAPRPPGTTMTMRWLRGEWIIDVGSCHGFWAGHGMVKVAVLDSVPMLEARVVASAAAHSVVEPIGWQPLPDKVYPIVVSSVELPPIAVAVGGREGDDVDQADRLKAAILTAGPGGGPSPHLRVVPHDIMREVPKLQVATPKEGELTVSSGTGEWLASAAGGQPETAAVRLLEHIAQWWRVRGLSNPASRLAGLVRVEVMLPRPEDFSTPRQRPGLRPGASGALELEYRAHEYGFEAPSVFIRLDNLSDRRLHCVLLNLTDRFRCHASLFPGAFIEAKASAAAADGQLVDLSLPPGRVVKAGAQVRDWLMLVVSEDEVNSACFSLPRLGEPPVAGARGGPADAADFVGIVERLALTARHRDIDRRASVAREWWTSVVQIVTRVPEDGSETGE